ncbi:MAG: ABC transporter ATP-binding protein [Lachnospiraceae bacterium]|nr:ABC transporter ATP-binding protein [Lachnospiraceae bacterium]
MINRVSYILDKKQKIKLFLLLIIIFVGAFVELLGVATIMPLVTVALEPDTIQTKWYLALAWELFGFTEVSQMIVLLALCMMAIYILKNLYVTFMYNTQYRFIFNNQRRLAVRMMDAYMHQNYLFHVSKNVAELQRNVTEDVNGFYTVVLNSLQLLAETSVCVVLVLFLMKTDITTTLVVAILIGIFTVLVGFVSKKVLVKKGQENRKLSIRLNKWVLQSFSGIKEIKVMNRENFFLKNYDDTYHKFTVIQRQQSMLTFISRPIMEAVCICGLLAVVVFKIAVQDAEITSFIPTLSVFVVAASRMLPSFNRISGYIGMIMFDKPSVEVLYNDLVEIDELRKKQVDFSEDAARITMKEGIRLEDVSFRYPENEKWVLQNINMTIKPNSSIALIGASGAGKTTLADVILGILEPQQGTIYVDAQDINKNMNAWHKSIGYIPQTIYLMDDTIRANIAFGVPEDQVDEAAMKKALKEAKLDEFVDRLPEGLDTIVGDRGVKLSGGQRQRIGIARALYQQPEILILDEATSALDNDTEKEVMEAIDGLHGNRTLIIIAHRLSTIKNCDIIYEVAGGSIIEKKHEEVFTQ